jgi:glycosyltransferase involved in cell wall biosynthesis
VPANDAPLLLDATRLIWRRWAGRHPTGIDRVCVAYLKHFAVNSQAVVQHRHVRRILDRESSAALFDILARPPANFRRAFISRALRFAARGSRPGAGRLYLNIGHTGLDNEGFRAWVGTADVRPIYFVHDLIPMTNPDFCRRGEAERHKRRMRTVLETASGVIGNSRATLDDLATFAEDQHLEMPLALADWLGTTPLPPRNTQAPQPERPSFVALGTIEARKNHLLLLRIWSRLVAKLGPKTPRLVIIGQRGWEADQVFEILDRDQSLRGHVLELNLCTDYELACHLATARALLFPSLAEGYGLPLVEALRSGTPVIASDLSAFREIGQSVPMLLDAADEASWEAAIVDFARPESAARIQQLRRLAGFRAPTWDGHFRRLDEWLAKIASDQAGPGATRSRS